jgi:uncharacterized membrane protein YeaQ/YmgE (transglycosylase-associated protein family)
MVIVGLVVGLLARGLLLGADHMGLLATACVGILGSFLGGGIGYLMNRTNPGTKFHPAGFFMSIIGAIILLVILRMVR